MSFRPNIKTATIDGDVVTIVGVSPNPLFQTAIEVTLEQNGRKATGVVKDLGDQWHAEVPLAGPDGGKPFEADKIAKASGTETRDAQDDLPTVTIAWSQDITIRMAPIDKKT